jgi:hypothetical protein
LGLHGFLPVEASLGALTAVQSETALVRCGVGFEWHCGPCDGRSSTVAEQTSQRFSRGSRFLADRKRGEHGRRKPPWYHVDDLRGAVDPHPLATLRASLSLLRRMFVKYLRLDASARANKCQWAAPTWPS